MTHTTNFKPPRGQYKAERLQRKADRVAAEDDQKDLVRKRDGNRCRWPFCRHAGKVRRKSLLLHVAHLTAKGMGGDPLLERSSASQMILLCEAHHLWDPQDGHPEGCLEHHQLRITPMTIHGTDGPCQFERLIVRMTDQGDVEDWITVAREREGFGPDTYGI